MDWGQGVSLDSSGNGYLCGYFESTSLVIGDTLLINPTGRNQIYLARKTFQPNSVRFQHKKMNIAAYDISNYPNPFNTTTTIEFSLDQTAFVELKIYNILGKEIFSLTVRHGMRLACWKTNPMRRRGCSSDSPLKITSPLVG